MDVCFRNELARLLSYIRVNLDATPWALFHGIFFELHAQIAATVQVCDWRFRVMCEAWLPTSIPVEYFVTFGFANILCF